MACWMARLSMTLSNYSMFTHKLESAPGLWFEVYCQRWRTFEGHSSHIHWTNDDISETVFDRDVVTTGHSYTAYLITAIVMTLSVLQGHSRIVSLLKCDMSYLLCILQSLCICRASYFSLVVSDHRMLERPPCSHCNMLWLQRRS